MTPEVTGHEVHQEIDTTIAVGGILLPAHIESTAQVTKTHYPAQNMFRRMEEAVQGEEEVEVDEASCEVTIYCEEKVQHINFTTTCLEFFHKYFDVDPGDLA